MSGEMLTIALSAVGLILALAGGFGWVIHRIDGVRTDLSAEIGGLRGEIVEMKVAIARIEGRLDARSSPPDEGRAVTGLQLS